MKNISRAVNWNKLKDAKKNVRSNRSINNASYASSRHINDRISYAKSCSEIAITLLKEVTKEIK